MNFIDRYIDNMFPGGLKEIGFYLLLTLIYGLIIRFARFDDIPVIFLNFSIYSKIKR